MHTHPAANDVVVRQKVIQRATLYVLRTPSCPDQLHLRSREAAVAHALAFARFAHLAAWFEDEAGGHVLLGSFRQAANSRSAMRPQAG